jgi:prolipoprotein diacylglyceryltransferase
MNKLCFLFQFRNHNLVLSASMTNMTGFVTGVTRRVPLVEQELLTRVHPWFLVWFVLCFVDFFCPLYCLSFLAHLAEGHTSFCYHLHFGIHRTFKIFASTPLKPLNQIKPNLAGMVIRRTTFTIVSDIPTLH